MNGTPDIGGWVEFALKYGVATTALILSYFRVWMWRRDHVDKVQEDKEKHDAVVADLRQQLVAAVADLRQQLAEAKTDAQKWEDMTMDLLTITKDAASGLARVKRG